MIRRRSLDDYEEAGDKKRFKRAESVDESKELEERLETLILRVGEKSTNSLESNLEGLASVLEADLANMKNKILNLLRECVVMMPEKLTIYSCLAGLLNARNYNFGGELVELVIRDLKDMLKTNKFVEAQRLVCFMADLVNCHVISLNSVVSLYETMAEVTNEENVPQVRSDWYVYAILSSLPYVGREFFEKKESELERLLKTVEVYMCKRSQLHTGGLRVWSTDIPHPQEEYLANIWAQVCNLRTNKWTEKHFNRPYLAFDSVLCEALQHNLPQFIVSPHHNECVYPYPTVVFRLFDYTDCPEGPILPGAHSIERYLIEEYMRNIIRQHKLERKDCAASLLSYTGKARIPLDYIIVEVIFGMLFKMPVPEHLEICYGSLLIELCKLQPSTMPQVLAQATELLYERIETMNVPCIDRFVNWLSYHLSNFQFRWSWEDWAESVTLDSEHPKPKFIKEVLFKCMRLSYHQRIVDIIPSQMEHLIPKKPEPEFKYSAEGAGSLPGTLAAHQLANAIKSKCSPEEILCILKDLPNPLTDEDGEAAYNPLKVDVFVQTLLHIASKSFSHAFAAIAKFHFVFKTISDTEEAQVCVLQNLFQLWHKHPHMMCVLIDKLLKTQVVECFAVANWVFSKDMSDEFTKMYVWEILNITIVKMDKHVTKLKTELADTKSKYQKEEQTDQATEDLIERIEERLETAQADQKNLFLIIFQRFIMLLSEHIVRCDTESVDFNTHWYQWTIGRLQHIFMKHHEQVFNYIQTLETLLFTADSDPHILQVFQQFAALKR